MTHEILTAFPINISEQGEQDIIVLTNRGRLFQRKASYIQNKITLEQETVWTWEEIIGPSL